MRISPAAGALISARPAVTAYEPAPAMERLTPTRGACGSQSLVSSSRCRERYAHKGPKEMASTMRALHR